MRHRVHLRHDCASFERCRIIGHTRGPTAPTRFADEDPPGYDERGTGVCDPFYDATGAISATSAEPSDSEHDWEPSEQDAGP